MTRLVLLALALSATPALAQNCSRAISQAQSSYQSGDFDGTIDRLTRCLDAGSFSSSERQQAYRLIGLSYIGKDREADAREAVARLLEVSPNYQPDPAIDPPPFVRMVNDERRRRPSTASGASRPAGGSGFELAVRGHGMSYSDSDDDTFTGAGGDLTLGYAVTPSITAYVQLSGSAGDGDVLSLSLGGASLGARYHLGQGALTPYIGAAGTFHSATYEATGFGSVDYTGGGGEVEGGVRYAFSPSLGVTGGVSAAFTSLSNDQRAVDVTTTVVRVSVGLSWRP